MGPGRTSQAWYFHSPALWLQGATLRQCSPMAVGPLDISGNDWCGPVNSSQAADRMSDENFGANPVFWAKI